MGLSEFLSSVLSVVHADAPQEQQEKDEEEQSVTTENNQTEANGDTEEQAQEEPEDVHPMLREECQNSAKCASLAKHFEHCQEKVQSGKGFKGEDCVEELMMHCVDDCVAPRLFSKLH